MSFQISPTSGQSNAQIRVTPLVDTNTFAWFQDISPSADVQYGGAYVMEDLGEQLFIGFSVSVPTRDNAGPVVAVVEDGEIRLVARLPEQDINRMRAVGDRLFIPGYDPTQAWDAGNLYIYDSQTDHFTQKRYRYNQPRYVASTVTNENGNYSFNGLKPTSYIVKFNLPDGYAFTQQVVGGINNRAVDSNPNPVTTYDTTCTDQRYPSINLLSPDSDLTIDAGLILSDQQQPSTSELSPVNPIEMSGNFRLGDLVWEDVNQNGLQDANELGIAGVVVELYTRDPYFPCIIHASGIWGDESGNIYYDGGINTGGVTFYSSDFGETWQPINQDNLVFWAYDFIFFNGVYYKTYRDEMRNGSTFEPNSYVMYSDNLLVWGVMQRLMGFESVEYTASNGQEWIVYPMVINDTNQMIVYQGRLLVLGAFDNVIYSIIQRAQYAIIEPIGVDLSGLLPDFTEPGLPTQLPNSITGLSNRYNTLINVNDELLYVIGGDNILYVSKNVLNWYPVADFNTIGEGTQLISLTYFEAEDKVVLATVGENGNIFTIDHAAVVQSIDPQESR